MSLSDIVKRANSDSKSTIRETAISSSDYTRLSTFFVAKTGHFCARKTTYHRLPVPGSAMQHFGTV